MMRWTLCLCIFGIVNALNHGAVAQTAFESSSASTRSSLEGLPTVFSGIDSVFGFNLTPIQSGSVGGLANSAQSGGILDDGSALGTFGAVGLSNVLSGGQQSRFGNPAGFGNPFQARGRFGFNRGRRGRNRDNAQILA